MNCTPINPPDDARIWHSLDALANAIRVTLYDEESAAVIQHQFGHWASPYAEFDEMAALGWVTLTDDEGEPAYVVTERGTYWLKRWAGRMLAAAKRGKRMAVPV